LSGVLLLPELNPPMKNTMTMLRLRLSFIAMTLLALAGISSANAADASPSGGTYVGYYQEDPLTNPEDPMPGAFVLKLPEKDAAFDGAMFFTFVGCQHSNVGKVKGVKSGNDLSGSWSGTIDESPESGPYHGSYDPKLGSYKGVYANSGGKQFKDIKGCIQYFIGPNGSWEMFPVEQSQPASFKVAVSASKVTWPALPNAAMTLVYVIDASLAQSGAGNPIKVQTVLPGQLASFNLATAGLVKGKEYIAVALVNNRQAARMAIASKRFVAP
jgi:hypothetical protein